MTELRELQVFRSVARTLSFTRAAAELYISQPVVSRTIREIERDLGVQLFTRTTRAVELTPEGRELLVAADDILDGYDIALGRFRSFCSGDRGRIVVAVLPSVAATVLPPVLRAFLVDYPDISIEILDVPADEAIRQVEIGRADLAITESLPATSELNVRLVSTDRMVAVLPHAHPLAGQTTLTWRELASEPFVIMSPGSSVRRLTDMAMAQAGVQPQIVAEARNISTAGGIIAAGLGVSAFPELVLPLLLDNTVETRALTSPRIHRELAVVTSPNQDPSPPACRFIDAYCAALSNLASE